MTSKNRMGFIGRAFAVLGAATAAAAAVEGHRRPKAQDLRTLGFDPAAFPGNRGGCPARRPAPCVKPVGVAIRRRDPVSGNCPPIATVVRTASTSTGRDDPPAHDAEPPHETGKM